MKIASRSNTHPDARIAALKEAWSPLYATLRTPPDRLDVDAVHDLRVGARRLRALLRSMRGECNPTAYAQLQFDLTNLGRDLADARNADMHARIVGQLLAHLRRLNAKDKRLLRALLARMTDSARSALHSCIRQPAWQSRCARLDKLFALDDLLLRPLHAPQKELRVVLQASLDRAIGALAARKKNIRALHRQRIRLKGIRYVCESLAPRIGVDAQRTVSALKEIQDILGDIHDLDAASKWLAEASTQTPLRKALLDEAREQENQNRALYRRLHPRLMRRLKQLRRDIVRK